LIKKLPAFRSLAPCTIKKAFLIFGKAFLWVYFENGLILFKELQQTMG
jgi:hypothetical protein